MLSRAWRPAPDAPALSLHERGCGRKASVRPGRPHDILAIAEPTPTPTTVRNAKAGIDPLPRRGGAGAIMKEDVNIRGLNAAATSWRPAAAGAAKRASAIEAQQRET